MTDLATDGVLDLIPAMVLYTARYGEDPARQLARDAAQRFDQIEERSGLSPTKALVIAGCIDAQVAHDGGGEFDVDEAIRQYVTANNIEYIERMIKALDNFLSILVVIADGLRGWVPDGDLRAWVVDGLDYPDPDFGPAALVHRTHIDKDNWPRAREVAEEFVAHVRRLPQPMRDGHADVEAFARSIAGEIALD